MKKFYSKYRNRDEYRNRIAMDLCCWQTEHKETELFICAEKPFKKEAQSAVVSLRKIIEDYIKQNKEFENSFVPMPAAPRAPRQIINMCAAAKAANVGPMAAVAGAFAEHVGYELLKYSQQVIVENGGDVFIKTDKQTEIAIYAGDSPLSMKIAIIVESQNMPIAVCTSSGKIGHSKSFGNADAAVVLSHDACLADACATRLGNEIKSEADIEGALDIIIAIDGIIGAVAITRSKCGAIGDIELNNI